MSECTDIELADMHLSYGMAEYNGRPLCSYARNVFRGGILFVRGNEQHGGECPTFCRRYSSDSPTIGFSQESGQTKLLCLSRFTIARILSANSVYPYHVHHSEALEPKDCEQRKEFALWFLQQTAAYLDFAASVFFMNESSFYIELSIHITSLGGHWKSPNEFEHVHPKNVSL
ncbi:hypothetical protein AVEN_267178-1 [Araneus ventricosus]|uniref:Uncharacterized protein n=1 Tax=Araneus ventricosus TaxID=182803 RepID=A0A4Y2UBQ0_ARAVE|nr:hypothetical protein AVEN_267178-1 [Araneus ventricosus]